jgi:multimeric flavodoxin WrbA
MKAIAINGSPRKNKNTATLLENALKGAASAGAKTKLIHLYDLNFKGCKGCFNCKRESSKNYGHCSVNDQLKPVLQELETADVVILGSPIYFGAVSGEMRSFMERLMFQYMLYTNPPTSSFKGALKVGFIYTMNISEQLFISSPMKAHLESNEGTIIRTFGNVKSLYSFDTNQLDDYSDLTYTYFDIEHKRQSKKEVFPVDCEKAFQLGETLAKEI